MKRFAPGSVSLRVCAKADHCRRERIRSRSRLLHRTHADMILASEDAKFGMAFANVGLIPDLGGLYALPRLVGLQKAKSLYLQEETFLLPKQWRSGIVNKVTPSEKLFEESFELAKKVAGPLFCSQNGKSTDQRFNRNDARSAAGAEALLQAQCIQTESQKCGRLIFQEGKACL